MKIAELFEARKKRKKNRHSWWGGLPFAIVQSGTGDDTIGVGAGITGASEGISEGEQDFPQHAMLKQGFYIVRKEHDSAGDPAAFTFLYSVHRLMDEDEETPLAIAGGSNSAAFSNSWIFRRNVKDGIMEQERVGSNLDNFLKFKWWLMNKLISSGVVADAKQIRRKSR